MFFLTFKGEGVERGELGSRGGRGRGGGEGGGEGGETSRGSYSLKNSSMTLVETAISADESVMVS